MTQPSSAGSPTSARISAGTSAGTSSSDTGTAGRPSRNRSTSTKVTHLGGVRTVKWYSVSAQELTSLVALQGLATFFAALGPFMAGAWLSTKQALEMAPADALSPAIRGAWETFCTISGWSAVTSGGLFVLFCAINGLHVWSIYRGTKH